MGYEVSCLMVRPPGVLPASDRNAASSSPAARAWARPADPVGDTRSRIATPGWCVRKRRSRAGRSMTATAVMAPIPGRGGRPLPGRSGHHR
jgi:hypothetical protein